MNSVRVCFRAYLVLGIAFVGLYFLIPAVVADPNPVQNLALVASNLTALTAILVSWRRRRLRPTSGWLLIATFPAATAVGNTIYFVNDSILDQAPFPSWGDAAFLGGYLLLAVGLLRLQQARSMKRDLPAVIDTAIITVGFAAASWVFFMAPLLADGTASLAERLTALGYPVADVLSLVVAARFFLTSRRRGPVFSWLAGTVLVMLVADTVFAITNLTDYYRTGVWVDALILTYNLGWGAVAMHPDADDLSRSPETTPGRPSVLRLVVLTAASLIAPIVLVVQVETDQLDDVLVTAGASAVLFLLVVARMAALVRDLESVLSQRRSLEVELEHRAHHDDLTGLANRRMFVDQLQRALEGGSGRATQVLFIDLDRFKSINDSLGHSAGDTLLCITGRRLTSTLRAADTVARLGGDEFAVLLGDGPPDRTLAEVTAKLAAALEEPVPLQGLELRVTASIGTAEAQPHDALEDLMHRADLAMYAQKARTDRRRPSASAADARPAASNRSGSTLADLTPTENTQHAPAQPIDF